MPRIFFLSLILGLFACSAWAQQGSTGSRVAALTAPLGDERAIAVVRVDATKLDFQAAIDWMTKVMKANEAERTQLENGLKEPREFVKAFRDAGGKEVIWLFEPSTGETRDFVDISGVATATPGKAAAVSEVVRKLVPPDRFELAARGDNVHFGSAARLKKLNPAAKPSTSVAKAIDAAGNGAA